MISAELDMSPFTEQLPAGTIITIVAPSTATVGGVSYNFDHWEDGSKSLTRAITLTMNATVTVYYMSAVPPIPTPNPLAALATIVATVGIIGFALI